MKKLIIPIIYIMSMSGAQLLAQTPTDAVMMKQRELCFALVYDHGSFDEYYEGTELRSNATIATVSRKTVLPMVAIGLHDRLNLIVAAPYIKTRSSEPNGGKFAGADGFQDVSVVLKGELLNRSAGPGKLVALAAIGYSTPMTNYLSDYMPYSLGLGTNEVSSRAIIQYKLTMGLYARVSAAYLWRGQTEAERDYYYNNGSYYTAMMDVPSAWNYYGVVGIALLDNKLKIEASYQGLRSVSGDDIRRYNAPQPTNKVEFGQVGFFTQYYIKQVKGLGVLASYSHILSGRNAGKSQNISGGITYQFSL